MPDKTTYESEMNTPSHRPGMEGVVNRGEGRPKFTHSMASQPVDADDEPRHVVSPPTRSAFGADSASAPPPKEEVKAPPPADDSPGSGIGGRERTQKILNQVDDMG